MQIPINNTLRLQSPYLFCQAVGSDGTDGTQNGVHVRWDLMRELGYNHIPKGNLASTSAGFNKSDDFVSLYKAQFFTEEFVLIDFSNIDWNSVEYLPEGEGIRYTTATSGSQAPVVIRISFSDKAQYSAIMEAGLDPSDPIQDFLSKYTAIIEFEVENKLVFNYEAIFSSPGGTGDAVVETVSIFDRVNNKDRVVMKRQLSDVNTLLAEGISTTAENIKTVRLLQTGMPVPQEVKFFTYEDQFAALQDMQSWSFVGDFSLSLTDNEVFTRFQGSTYSGGSLVLNWPKYDATSGVLLNPDNYADRWTHIDDGLKLMVQDFINLSDTDPRANTNFPSEDGITNGLSISLLDMLKLAALDYHAARMLGLGHLDEINEAWYIYAAVYTTSPSLPGIGIDNDHVFMTLPANFADQRLPVAPELHAPQYGLYVTTDENEPPQLISDVNGYSYYENIRFINLHKTNINAPQPVQDTIPEDYFDASTVTQPASFGIKYKASNEGSWRVPELLYDDEYNNLDNNPEPVTTPERDTNPLYTHKETEQGVHEYAIYSVNWFSRASGLSNSAVTNNTSFPTRSSLLPPVNAGVQYIQEEDPLIFTTQNEQAALAAANNANPNGDNYKTRVSFDWNDLHHNAYQLANKIEFFFRDSPIKKVEGQVKSVSAVSETTSLVVTRPFVMTSVNPAVTITPAISPGDVSKFIGSLFNTPEGQFEILSISQPTVLGDGPSFVVKNLVATELMQAGQDEPFIAVPVYTRPKADDVFFTFENVSNSNQWVKLTKTLDLVNFSNTTETIHEDDGSTRVAQVNGINGNATIQEILDANGPTGGYTVQFNSGVNLNPHPDSSVSWVKGSARFVIDSTPNKKKRLAVVSIQQTSPITIVVYDPDYYTTASERIRTGTNQPVNFHPGYKIYLSPEAGVFDKTKTMPAGTANNKKTFIALRSVDTTKSATSALTQPIVLVARNIQKPVMPEAILSPAFATRPDFYKKSSYTLDIQLNISNRVPYGVVVYRASEMSILQALYKTETLDQVLKDLAGLEQNDPYYFNRWKSLVEVETDPADNNQFKLFGTYRFPNPDNNATDVFVNASTVIHPFPLQAGQTIFSQKAIIRQVIEDIFSLLTETPIIFAYLKTGYQTSAEPAKTRDLVGRLLAPTDPSFNPFPMATRFPAVNPNTVRFTDYTLDGNARNIYFYFAREVAVDTKLSERTPVVGPVVLIDAAPAEKPVIEKIVTKEENSLTEENTSVIFHLGPYISPEKIRQLQLFRTTDFSNAASVRTMQLANTFEVSDIIEDTFVGDEFLPYGQPLYYRIVALREIINEAGEIEMIPSEPSDVALTNIIDVQNPPAPEITATVGSTQTNGSGQVTALLNVALQWPQSVFNATYHLYRMSTRGTWEKLWSKKTNATQITFPENGDFVTWPQTANLPKLDADGSVIYHRFKVAVENASGLFNVEDIELVI
jgi:hypothetical protein